ncbi:olfactory receptor 1019-like [Rhinatrema bivittatum]|uniref:olfactory receptor 1019-like n=1 Tax=Rhinatrema bivittatum TaxID=194408 RepID=UPI00112C92AD|nr:olfactory receptor 1019-like [Rhinatrema bivittatum]
MAYDRYVAICNPLRYSLIMNKSVCILLMAASWIAGFLEEIPIVVFVSQFSYCGIKKINHFFCDLNAIIKLSCSDTHILETLILTEIAFFAFFPLILTLSSYIFIIKAILKIRSSEGRHKAFSTCSAHLAVIILFYGTLMSTYMRPSSMYSPDLDKLFSLLYTALTPMLNPIIYSLRNQEVKIALRKVRDRKQ